MSHPARTGRALTTFSILIFAIFSGLALADHSPGATFHIEGPTEFFRMLDPGTFQIEATNSGILPITEVVLEFGPPGAIDMTSVEVQGEAPNNDPWDADSFDDDTVVITAQGDDAGLENGETWTITISFAGRTDGPVLVAVDATGTDALGEHEDSTELNIGYPGVLMKHTNGNTVTADNPITLQEMDPGEAVSTKAFDVVLRAPPLPDTEVDVTIDGSAAGLPNDHAEFRLSGEETWTPSITLTFADTEDPDNDVHLWDAPQTVNVRPIRDIVDEPVSTGSVDAQGDAVLKLTAASGDAGYDGLQSAGAVKIIDDDTAQMELLKPSLQVSEAGAQDSFQLRPLTKPSNQLKVTVTSNRPSEAKIVVDANDPTKDVANIELTFSGTDPQTVVVRGQDDSIDDGTQSGLLTFTRTGAPEYAGKMPPSLRFHNSDDDTAALTVLQLDADCDDEDSETVVRETAGQNVGNSDCLSVALTTQPSAGVTITVTSSDTSRLIVDDATVTFTTANWNVPKTVEVSAVDDDVVGTTTFVDVVFSGEDSAAVEYQDVTATRSVRILDDEDASIQIDPDSLTIAEGDQATFDVSLGAEPTTTTRVSIASEGLTFSPSTVTFTPGNFDTAQTVTVAAADNDILDGTRTHVVLLSVTNSGAEYADVTNTLEIDVEDDEEAGIEFDGPTWVEIDGSVDVRVRLTAQPAGTVVLDVDAGDGSATPDTLTFTALNWDSYRTIQVDAPETSGGLAELKMDLTLTVDAAQSHDAWDDAHDGVHTIRVFDYDELDLAQINEDLQDTVTVTGETVSWDSSGLDVQPIGLQIWRATSPFAIIATVDEGTTAFVDEEYVDSNAPGGAAYVVTAFYGDTERSGFFGPGASLSDVPGYEGTDEDEQKKRAVAVSGDDGFPRWIWIAVGAAVLLVILVIILIAVLASRRNRDDETDEEWDSEYQEEPHQETAPVPEYQETAWAPMPEDPAGPEETFHLTCPQCRHDFEATGTRPLKTRCPQCGVQGLVR